MLSKRNLFPLALLLLLLSVWSCTPESINEVVIEEQPEEVAELAVTEYTNAYLVTLPYNYAGGESHHQLILTDGAVFSEGDLRGQSAAIILEYSGARDLLSGDYSMSDAASNPGGTRFHSYNAYSRADFATFNFRGNQFGLRSPEIRVEQLLDGGIELTYQASSSRDNKPVHNIRFSGTPEILQIPGVEPVGESEINGNNGIAYRGTDIPLRHGYLKLAREGNEYQSYRYNLYLAVEDAMIEGQLRGTSDVVLLRFDTPQALTDGRYRLLRDDAEVRGYLSQFSPRMAVSAYCRAMDFTTNDAADDDWGDGETIIEINDGEIAVSASIDHVSATRSATTFRGILQEVE